jgi:hypothetical protein
MSLNFVKKGFVKLRTVQNIRINNPFAEYQDLLMQRLSNSWRMEVFHYLNHIDAVFRLSDNNDL